MAAREVARERAIAAALALMTLLLYSWRLSASPLHLHYDEIFFGLQAHSIQTTGHDLNGRLLPIYFQLENTFNWYQPMAVYWSALVLQFVPISDAAIRLPSVLVATINVVLMFFVARRLTASLAWAVVAAAMLMLTPAHFIHSRLAMDYVYPLPWILGWLLCMLRYESDRSPRMLFAGALCLGFCFFSYIAGTALAPLFLVGTLALIVALRRPWQDGLMAMAGFAVPVIAAALFITAYPDTVPDLMQKYGVGGQTASSGLDPLQRVREAINPRTVSDALNHYWRFFSPGYLFVTGGSNLTNSTRAAGVFAPTLALLLIVGIVQVLRRGGAIGVLLLLGLIAAPIPAAALPEDFTIDRHLASLPFAVLLAVLGARALWTLPNARPVRRVTTPLAIAVGVVAIAYLGWTLISRGTMSASAPLLLLVAAAIFAIGIWLQRARTWQPVAVVALVLMPLTFAPFLADYFNGYPLRSANWFGGNIRGAIASVIRAADEQTAPEIRLSTDIPYIQSYWRFYLITSGRTALLERTKTFDKGGAPGDMPAGTVLLSAGGDAITSELASQGSITRIDGAADESGGPEQFTVYRALRP